MKKLVPIFLAAFFCAAAAGCSAKPDYMDCISEKRSDIFLYSDDSLTLQINCVCREQPFNADGIRGEMCELTEIFAKFAKTPSSAEIELCGHSGEMNYSAVKGEFSLVYSSPALTGEGVDVKISADGQEREVRALSVKDAGVISCESAVRCAAEHDRELFSSLTARKAFKGEIFVRLLYDEGCYYYVGVCDREKNITAMLLDGNLGKVIATKKLKAETAFSFGEIRLL